MPDYAEVAGCSTFKNTTTSPLYDSFGAYATTNVVRNTNTFGGGGGNHFLHANKKSNNSLYSAPTICHFNTNDGHNFAHSDANFGSVNKTGSKMNIIENKIDLMNNLNRSSSSANGSVASVAAAAGAATMSGMANGPPATPIIGMSTMRRNRLPKLGHCDKISFGGGDNGRNIDQPLFIKSTDGSWTSVQNSSYHFSVAPNAMTKGSGDVGNDNGSGDSKYRKNGSNNNGSSSNQNSVNNNGANAASSQIYLSSFGKADNV